jgi:hypothetical protein
VIVAEARRLSSSGQVAFMEETRNVKNIFVWNFKRRGHFGNHGFHGRIILKMDPREAGCVDMKWIEMAQDWVQ